MNDYSLYFSFLNKFLPSGFKDIDRKDPLVLEIERMTVKNRQFFFTGDLLQMKIYFASNRCLDMMDVSPELLDPSRFFTSTHPDDLKRHNLARTKLFNLGQTLYIEKSDQAFLSTNLRFRKPDGSYMNTLLQGNLIYTTKPYETVFYIQVNTDISWFKKIRHGYHYYIGNDPSFFRYPDENLLMTGHLFSDREFQILEMISQGLNSEQIAAKLFLSTHTINTHRRNILKKTGKINTNELVLELRDRGVI